MPRTHISIPVFVPHQGCPHRCSFCDQHAVSGARENPGQGTVRAAADKYLSSARIAPENIEIAFFGGSFTAIPEKIQEDLLSAAAAYLRSGRIGGIRLSTRPDAIDSRKLEFLRGFGVTCIELGAQSFQDSVLNLSGRGHTSLQTVQAARLITGAGFSLVIQLLPGLPGETRERALESARTAISLAPQAVRIYPAVVLEGTGLAALYRSGQYSPLSLEEAVELCADLRTLFDAAGIPVIRTGLHPLGDEKLHRIITGPYHPALGFLVKSRMRRRAMEESIQRWRQANPGSAGIHMTIPADNKEEYIGTRRQNISYLSDKYCLAPVSLSFGPGEEFSVY